MPTLNFITKYKKNDDVIISADELSSFYFYGVDILSKDGSRIDESTVRMYILAAQQEIEKYFNIKLFWQLMTETVDYYRDDYNNNFPFIKTTYPVKTPRTLIGLLNGVEQIVYPEQWLQSKRTNDNHLIYRNFSVIPNGSVVNSDANVILTGVSAQYGLRAYPVIPNYWTVQYETGYKYDSLPFDLLNLIGLLGSIGLFAIAGDLILGAGIASQSLSIDGLSQSISSTSSATNAGYGSRIIEYRKSIDATVKRLQTYYKGITFTCL